MTTSPAPDVDRVLDRMGRSTIGYRSFPRSVEALAEAVVRAPDAVVRAPDATNGGDQAAIAAAFGLIDAALPSNGRAIATAPVGTAPIATAPVALAPAAVAPVPMAPLVATNPFLPSTAAAPAVRDNPVRLASLSEMFRILSGDSTRASPRGDADRQDTVFPFRRR